MNICKKYVNLYAINQLKKTRTRLKIFIGFISKKT